MSFVSVTQEYVAAAASDLADIGVAINYANQAAAGPTSVLAAAGADEVSAAIAAVFGSHAQQYQAVTAQAAELHDRFVQALRAAGRAYGLAEATNASPLQTAERAVLALVNAPTEAVLQRPLVGNGANGTAAHPNGWAGGVLYGNGGNGFTQTATGVAGGAGGAAGLIGAGGAGG
ncbi:PE family protein, partial [Mycobacterium angelicum]